MQKFQNVYDYIHDYQHLVYEYYAKDVVPFLATYYHINGPATIWEDEHVFAGSYDRIGEYSGVKWNKILLLPIYYSEEVNTAFDGQDIGYVKEGETSFVIPSAYNITPLPNDKVKFEQQFLRPTNDVYPVFNISGVEKSVNTDFTYWKLRAKVEQSITETQLEAQVQDTYVFFDYDKNIHTVTNSTFLTRLLVKNETLRERLRYSFYDRNSGFYFVP